MSTANLEVTMQRYAGDQAYSVRVTGGDDELGYKHAKTFLWGTFDEGDVSWQRAYWDARNYAAKLSKQLGIRYVVR